MIASQDLEAEYNDKSPAFIDNLLNVNSSSNLGVSEACEQEQNVKLSSSCPQEKEHSLDTPNTAKKSRTAAKSLFSSLVAREKRKFNSQFFPPRPNSKNAIATTKKQPEPEPKKRLNHDNLDAIKDAKTRKRVKGPTLKSAKKYNSDLRTDTNIPTAVTYATQHVKQKLYFDDISSSMDTKNAGIDIKRMTGLSNTSSILRCNNINVVPKTKAHFTSENLDQPLSSSTNCKHTSVEIENSFKKPESPLLVQDLTRRNSVTEPTTTAEESIIDNIIGESRATGKITSTGAHKRKYSTSAQVSNSSLFSTGSGKSLEISKESITRAKNRLSTPISTKPKRTSLFSSGNGKPLVITSESILKAKQRMIIPRESETVGLSLFASANGKELKISKESIVKAKKRLSTPSEPNGCSLSTSKTGNAFPISTESKKKQQQRLFTPTTKEATGSSLFSSGCGKSLTISSNSIAKAKMTLNSSLKEQSFVNSSLPNHELRSIKGKAKKSLNLSRKFVGDKLNKANKHGGVVETINKSCTDYIEKILNFQTVTDVCISSDFKNLLCQQVIKDVSITQTAKKFVFFAQHRFTLEMVYFSLLQVLKAKAKVFTFSYFILNLVLVAEKVDKAELSATLLLRKCVARYIYEMDYQKSPLIKKIFDEGFKLSALFVLSVYKVISDTWVVLTDGWYLLPANINGKLVKYIKSGVIKKGIKIGLCGPGIVNFTPDQILCPIKLSLDILFAECVPSTLIKKPYLRISFNCCKPAIEAKLGEQKITYFTKKITHCEPKLGKVSCIEGILYKIFDIFYGVKSNGKTRLLNELELELYQQHNSNLFEFERDKLAMRLSPNEPTFEKSMLELRDKFFPRISNFIRFQIVDKYGGIAELTYWNPPSHFLTELHEGKAVRAFFLEPTFKKLNKVSFKVTRTSFILFHHNIALQQVFETPMFNPSEYRKVQGTMPVNFIGILLKIIVSKFSYMLFLYDFKTQNYVSFPCKTLETFLLNFYRKSIGQLVCLRNVIFEAIDPSTGIYMFKSKLSSGCFIKRVPGYGREISILNQEIARLRNKYFPNQNLGVLQLELENILNGNSNKENIELAANQYKQNVL